MTDRTAIDDLVRLLREKRSELALLGRKIAQSSSDTTVLFADLSDSTSLKNEVAPEEWLGYVYEFIQLLGSHETQSGGTIIKRIGDELMLSFPRPPRLRSVHRLGYFG